MESVGSAKESGRSFERAIARTRGARVYFDSNASIYLHELTTVFGERFGRVLEASKYHEVFACTGYAAIAELLVKPMRDRDTVLVGVIDALFVQTAMIEVLVHSGHVSRLAASLRAERKLSVVDALHLATAVSHRCRSFVSKDADFKSVDGVALVNLSHVVLN